MASLKGQNSADHRDTTFVADQKLTLNSRHTIIPRSIKIVNLNGGPIPNFLLDNNKITFEVLNATDSIHIHYKTLSIDLKEQAPVLNTDEIQKKSYVIKISEDLSPDEVGSRRLIESNKLQYTGSFSRGINFGNTQDLVLNSDFNLQMSGDLGNGLFIRAAISDDNIPIQPEGNTQVLQEFDKVFMEIQKDRTKLIAGDYELARPDSYFMNYYKKLKGFSVSNTNTSKNGWEIANKGSFAISRGKFKRLNLETQEGNQGPYRLEGENGDLFLQVLSGTEKVYSDGKLLKRGDNYDYVIDYNRAEIRFTPNIVINEYSRIIVEYEFATQSYLRSLYATTSSFKKDKIKFDINFYTEQDSKNATSNIELDSTDLAILAESDNDFLFRSGLFIPENNDFTGLIKYQLNNDILTYAPEATENVVSARFSNVGEGLGSYEIDDKVAANGRVYTYVGEGLGNFDPVIQLTAPEKKQLITGSMQYDPNSNTSIYVEAATSIVDNNRFSELDNNNNLGLSAITRLTNTRTLGTVLPDTIMDTKWQLKTTAEIEVKQKAFTGLNPYRAPEFNRDWNLTGLESSNDQLLHNTSLLLSKKQTSIGYSLAGFHDRAIYSGYNHLVEVNHQDNSWLLSSDIKYLLSDNSFNNENGEFLRPKLLIKRKIYKEWALSGYYEKERNINKDNATDSLNSSSFNYDLYRMSVSSDQTKAFHINTTITKRYDDRPLNNTLSRVTEATDYSTGGQWSIKKNSDLKWNITFRDFEDLDMDNDDDSKQTVLGNIEHDFSALNRGLVLNSYYESENGQEPKVEFQYIQVQKGEGSYVWEDFNQDSIPQINEFRIAPQADLGAYEKIAVYNNEFISSNKSAINQSLKIIPKKFIKNKKHFINKFQLGLRYRIEQRSAAESGGNAFINPILTSTQDTNLITYNASIDNNLFYNRGSASHDVQLSYRNFTNIATQITGTEGRGNKEFYTRSRLNLVTSLDAVLETSSGLKTYDSEPFPEQNFDVQYWSLSPQINYRPSPKLRLVAKYTLENNQNRILDMERSEHHDASLDLTWRRSATSSLQAKASLVLINFEGQRNTPVEFELLNGLTNGTNYLWSFNYTRRVGKNFDMILNYNGRKSESSKTVNNLGVQLRAVF